MLKACSFSQKQRKDFTFINIQINIQLDIRSPLINLYCYGDSVQFLHFLLEHYDSLQSEGVE